MSDGKMIYIWDTSIPDKWRKIAGEDHFIHISKSNRAKNTLEFMIDTQRYIHQIRSSVNAPNYSPHPSQPNFKAESRLVRNTDKKSTLASPNPETQPQQKEDINIVVSNPYLTDQKEPCIKELPQLPNIPKLAKHRSEVQFSKIYEDKIRKRIQKTRYTKSIYKKPADFICLPKALQANSNRIANFLSPRIRNDSISTMHLQLIL